MDEQEADIGLESKPVCVCQFPHQQLHVCWADGPCIQKTPQSPTRCHQVVTKCPNIWGCGEHFNSNYKKVAVAVPLKGVMRPNPCFLLLPSHEVESFALSQSHQPYAASPQAQKQWDKWRMAWSLKNFELRKLQSYRVQFQIKGLERWPRLGSQAPIWKSLMTMLNSELKGHR